MSRSLLVTGGAGFLGSHFVAHIVAHTDDRVTVLDTLSNDSAATALADFPPSRVSLVVGNVQDERTVDDLVVAADVVVHFAAQTHNDTSLVDSRPFVDANVMGTYVVLEAVRRRGRRLHYISTDEVYGDVPLDSARVVTEDAAFRPSSPYAATKAAGDLMVQAWSRSFGVAVTTTNSCNAYGAFQSVEKFIPRQITNILTGVRPQLYGNGRHVRDWLHADDHAAAVLAVLDGGRIGERYIVSAGEERDNRTVVRRILELMGRSPDDVDYVRDRPGHDMRYAVDSTKIRTEVGWRPTRTLLDEGLVETIDWYRTHESWWSGQKERVEAAYARDGA